MATFIAWWRDLVNRMNEKGIPVPMARSNGKPSITATMVMVSFALCAIPVLLMIGTVITKLAGVFTLNDANEQQLMNAFSSAIQLYIASLGAYLGRGMQRGSDGKVIMEKASEPAEKTE